MRYWFGVVGVGFRLRMLPRLCVLAGLLTLCAHPSLASPLTDEKCEELMGHFVALKKSGIDVDMAPGPENARQRLGPDRLLDVKRYLDINAMILFRCPRYSMTGPGAPHNIPVRNPKPRRATASVLVRTSPNDGPPIPVRKQRRGS